MSTTSDERLPAPAREQPSKKERSRPRPVGRRSPRSPTRITVPAEPAPTPWGTDTAAFLLEHRLIVAVLSLFVLSALIVPTMTPAPVGDDWVYARSVEILLHEGRLQILDLSVVTLVFQVFWGALFAFLFGDTFGALRLSTVTLALASGWACYGLCRELGVDRTRSALGTAAYLFNPLAFVLAFSFMTDPQFTALLVIASLGYLRGLRPGPRRRPDNLALLAGSIVAACAFLVRQQGALIPLAVVLALILGRRLRLDLPSAALVVRIVAVPVAAVVAYYCWLILVQGVPEQQQSFTRSMREAGWGQSWLLFQRLTFIEAMYLGLFTLPLFAAALVALAKVSHIRSALGWTIVAAWAAMLLIGLAVFAAYGHDIPPMPRMPYIPQYLGPTGLGPSDLHGGRPWLVGWGFLGWVTAVCTLSSLLFVLALCRRIPAPRRPDTTRAGAGILLSIALWQVLGVLPPSFHFRNWIISVDRYLLPLLPFALCLGLWALRNVRLALPAAWIVAAAFAALAVFGTRDFLVLQGATWSLDYAATEIGVPLTQLDGGASWDGYYLWEYSRANGIQPQTRDGPWWTSLFGPATDSSYIVSTGPRPGYTILGQVEYSSWLDGNPTFLFLLRREGLQTMP